MDARAQADVVVRKLLAAWNARDMEGFTALLTPDIYWHDLGRQAAVRRFSESVLRAFPDFQYEFRGPLCVAEDGSTCVLPWTIVATHSGSLDPPGFAPTGRRVRFSGLDYLTLRDGLVARIETRFDPVEPIEQLLGCRLRPPAGSWRERCFVVVQRLWAAWLRRKPAAV